MKLDLPSNLASIIAKYTFVKDELGMSPTEVYKVIAKDRILYLKMSGMQFQNTTYDVEREKNILLWLEGKIPVPRVIHYETDERYKYLLMSEIEGVCLSEQKEIPPHRVVEIYVESIKTMQSIEITDCVFNSNIEFRLSELEYLLKNKLAAEDDFREGSTPFKTPEDLVDYLKTHVPNEDLTFSHGDLCNGNIITNTRNITGFIDWARGGKADKWYDIAFCVRSIRDGLQSEQYVDLFFKLLGVVPNWDKIEYFILLDELF